jgi:hypothetical protein
LRALDPNVHVGFTSGYSHCWIPEINNLGKEYFIQKPFQTDVLIQKVKEMLSKLEPKV